MSSSSSSDGDGGAGEFGHLEGSHHDTDADADDGTVDVSEYLASRPELTELLSVREWRAAGKALATPSRRSPSRLSLVSTILGYQLAEQAARKAAR